MAKKALVVDDTPYIRADIREILERNGFEVIEAENGAEAVEIYKGDSLWIWIEENYSAF